jgi:hypothetical protein
VGATVVGIILLGLIELLLESIDVDGVLFCAIGGWLVFGCVVGLDVLIVIDVVGVLLAVGGEHGPTSFHACSHSIFTSSSLPPPPLLPSLFSFFIVLSASSKVSILQNFSYELGRHLNIVL